MQDLACSHRMIASPLPVPRQAPKPAFAPEIPTHLLPRLRASGIYSVLNKKGNALHRDALARPAQPRPPPIDSREFARILRPWGLSTLLVIGYVGYVVHDTLPEVTRYTGPGAQPGFRAQPAPPVRERTVLKCIDGESTTYSDGACAPGAFAQRLTLLPESGPASDLRPVEPARQVP